MYANVGDRLVVDDEPPRAGIIIDVPHDDGSPPYVVKWLADGHIAMVFPDQFARLVRATAEPGRIGARAARTAPTETS